MSNRKTKSLSPAQRVVLLAAIAAYCDLHEEEYEYFYNDVDDMWIFDNEINVVSPWTGKVTAGTEEVVDDYLKSKLKPIIQTLLPLVKRKENDRRTT